MTDAEKQIREALADPALFDPGASTADTYSACKAFGTACTPEAIRELLAERDALKGEVERRRQHVGVRDEMYTALLADAERYRWLREQPNDTTAPRIDVVRWIPADESVNDGEGLRLDELDAAIDAAKEQA